MSNAGFERESVIRFCQEEPSATVTVYDIRLRRTLDRLTRQHPEQCKRVWERQESGDYIIPKKWVKIEPPRERKNAPLDGERREPKLASFDVSSGARKYRPRTEHATK